LTPSLLDQRFIGEILYQLEQRMFRFIFKLEPMQRRDILHGFLPLDFKETILNMSLDERSIYFGQFGSSLKFQFVFLIDDKIN
jgi:hypothetical protein